MSKPDDYTEEHVAEITDKAESTKQETTVTKNDAPNIICVLLESFCDPDEIKFLHYNDDPIPTFHKLEENYSTGYLTVPVVGAGTANSEFEVLTGMSMQYFGTGEYPYKTILKKTDCESTAADLASIGYGTHAVHNNGGNFYSRVNAFSMMGFDTFTSKELMNIQTYTPNGSWATDDILVDETIKTLDSTPNQPDFTYTITVGTHGDYPKEQVIENPKYTANGAFDEETRNQWTYYINQLNEVDTFMADLIDKVSKRDENTVIVFFGDHLPTMGLQDSDMRSGDIYKTKYVTWNNMGLEKQDADLYAYQLMASITNSVGIHEGTILNYHIVMGIDPVTIDSATNSIGDSEVILRGSNFTKWSKVFVNGSKVNTIFSGPNCLIISKDAISDGDTLQVNQMGSNNTVFRSSNTLTYSDSDVVDTQAPVDGTEVDTTADTQNSESAE